MIIYNKTWLNNLRIQNEVEQAHDLQLLSTPEQEEIKIKYPTGFYIPGVWIRIGLFILTIIIASSASGLLSLLFADAHIIDSAGWIFFLCACMYVPLELMTRKGNHYQSGVDNALILMTGGFFLAGLYWLTFENLSFKGIEGVIFISGIFFGFCLFLALRFADLLATTTAVLTLFIFIFFSGYQGDMTAALPFIMIISATIVYLLAYRYEARLWYYSNALVTAQLIALVILYFSGNYFVVRTLNENLSNYTDAASTTLPFGFFFWIWTVSIPLIYIGMGLKKKNIVLLRCGLLLVAAAAFTIRNYFHLMSMEAILCLIGAVLTGIAYGVIRYLHTPKYGFTSKESDDKHLMDKMRLESLIIAETFSGAPSTPVETSRFGGGDFGGGGASGNF